MIEPVNVEGMRAASRPARERQPLTPAKRIRRALTLLAISLLAPGTAQMIAGNRRSGRVVVLCWLGCLGLAALAGFVYLFNRALILSITTSSFVLVLVACGLFAMALVWPIILIDAWRLGRPQLLPRRPRLLVSGLTLALVLATSVPLVGAGRRVWAGADFIDDVFGSGPVSAAHQGRYNVLLMGGDAGPNRIGTRPDSMTLVSIDAETGRSVLFSLPRNLEDVPFAPGSAAERAMPRGWSCGDSCLLNGIYTWGQEHKDLFPGEADPGAAAMKQAVSGITGLEVNSYVLIDLSGFRRLIDAMGGIDIKVGQRVPIGGGTSRVSGYIEPGTRHLDGYHALWYARSRHGANDYERMARQRCVMDAMLRQLDPGTVLAKFQGLAAAGRSVLSTDIPAAQLGTFLDLAVKAKQQKISSVQFVPPLIDPARPDLHLIHQKVSAAITASENTSADSAKVASRAAASGSSRPTTRVPDSGAADGSSASASATAEATDVSAICSPA